MKEYEKLANALFDPEEPPDDFMEMLAEIDKGAGKIRSNIPGYELRSSQIVSLAYVVWRLLQ